MAKYNKLQEKAPAPAVKIAKPKVANLAGGRAYKESDNLELVSMLLTSFMDDKFYRSEAAGREQLKRVLDMVDPEFAAKAALYARREFGMRSISHVVAAELAARVKGAQWTKTFFERIVRRPDDMFEILGYYRANIGKNEPAAMRKGFARAIEGLDEYQLAKYLGTGRDINMLDLVNLTHPRPTPALSALMGGTLKPAETWEVALTQAGQSDEGTGATKGAAWEQLLRDNKLGYFALLRNLRNIVKDAPDAVDIACEQLTDERRIRGSLVLPFRFAVARDTLKSVPGTAKAIGAVERAADIALGNIPDLPGKTLVILDVSSSMTWTKGRDAASAAQKGALFAAALVRATGADLVLFGTDASYHSLGTGSSVLAAAESLRFNYGGTNFHAAFNLITKTGTAYDRIIILSDMQGWAEDSYGDSRPTKGAFKAYKKATGADPMLYSIDLAGYGTLMFPEKRVVALAGFSEKIFDLMGIVESGGGQDALVQAIAGTALAGS